MTNSSGTKNHAALVLVILGALLAACGGGPSGPTAEKVQRALDDQHAFPDSQENPPETTGDCIAGVMQLLYGPGLAGISQGDYDAIEATLPLLREHASKARIRAAALSVCDQHFFPGPP